MRLELASRSLSLVAIAMTAASCSIVFSPDDLSKGAASTGAVTGGGGAAAGGGGSGGGCADDAGCDDDDECTVDRCEKGRCSHRADVGERCGPSTDCTPQGSCNAEARCVPAAPDPSLCDDKNPCTRDTCEVSGCAHAPTVGDACNDGNKCDDVGACNGSGQCVAARKIDQEICIPAMVPCPGNYYVADYHCDTVACGDCPLCLNAFKCSFACEHTFVACCNIGTGDCSASCPAGYHIEGSSVSAPQCGCGSGTGVNCVENGP